MSSSRRARCGNRSETIVPGLAVTGELARRGQQLPRISHLEQRVAVEGRNRLAVVPGELGLGVKRVDLADAAVHEKHDARLGLGGKCGFLGDSADRSRSFRFGSGGRSREEAVFRQEGGKRGSDEAAGRFPEELAAGAAARCQSRRVGRLVAVASVHRSLRSPANACSAPRQLL